MRRSGWIIGLGITLALAAGLLIGRLVRSPSPVAGLAVPTDQGTAASTLAVQRASPRPTPAVITREPLPEQPYVIDNADDIADQLEDEAFVSKPAQRACAGHWRFHDPEGQGSYTLDVSHVRYTLRPDDGPAMGGAVEPSDTTTVEMIGDDATGDAGIEQHFLKCSGKKAVLSGSHIGDEVTLQRF